MEAVGLAHHPLGTEVSGSAHREALGICENPAQNANGQRVRRARDYAPCAAYVPPYGNFLCASLWSVHAKCAKHAKEGGLV